MTPREKIRRLLGEQRFDQKSLAASTGISYATFRTYLRAKSPAIPAADTGVLIAEKFGVDAHWLWSDKPWEARANRAAQDRAGHPAITVEIILHVPNVEGRE